MAKVEMFISGAHGSLFAAKGGYFEPKKLVEVLFLQWISTKSVSRSKGVVIWNKQEVAKESSIN